MAEIASAFTRHGHGGVIPARDAMLISDFSGFDVLPLISTAERYTIQTMQHSRLQSRDALHIRIAHDLP